MVQKRPAGFNIPLNFYDGPEVESIPRRIRAAAIGVWALAGDYAATQLSDGFVPAGVLRSFGCTDAIRAALKVTINKKGELSPLWIDARDGGVQLTNWPKHQRTSEEVTTYRASEAERKRAEREARAAAKAAKGSQNLRAKSDELTPNLRDNFESGGPNLRDNNGLRVVADNAPTSDDAKVSGRTSVGRPESVRQTSGQTKTETETEIKNSGYVPESATDSNGRGSVAATPGAELVREIVPAGHPAATLTVLRIRSGELLKQGHPRADVAAALQLWCEKPSLGPNALASVLSEVIKSRAAPRANGHDAKVNDFLAFANRPTNLEIES